MLYPVADDLTNDVVNECYHRRGHSVASVIGVHSTTIFVVAPRRGNEPGRVCHRRKWETIRKSWGNTCVGPGRPGSIWDGLDVVQ